MQAFRILIALLACAAIGLAETVKLKTLAGKELRGELIKLDDKEITLRVKEKDKDGKEKEVEAKTPLVEVLDVDLQAVAIPAGSKYVDVELVDGSLLHSAQFALKNKDVELKLLAGQEVKLPLSAVAYVLNNAHEKAVRDEWKRITGNQGTRDLIAVKKGDSINTLDGTLGEGDAAGNTIGFELKGGDQPVRIKLERLHGMAFFRKREGNLEDPLCKLIDTSGNVLVVTKIAPGAAGSYTFTTGAGVKIEYPAPLLAKLDFSKGKLTYLSDLEPAKVVESSGLEGTDHIKRDKNLDGGPLRINGVAYTKGLAVPATTELIYDIGGDYKSFKAVVGFDDQVGGDSNVQILVEGDGREIYKTALKRADKKKIDLNLDIKNVKNLRIVVKSADLLDLGYHVNFADAKVSK
jgi:hypothetical protein